SSMASQRFVARISGMICAGVRMSARCIAEKNVVRFGGSPPVDSSRNWLVRRPARMESGRRRLGTRPGGIMRRAGGEKRGRGRGPRRNSWCGSGKSGYAAAKGEQDIGPEGLVAGLDRQDVIRRGDGLVEVPLGDRPEGE